MLLLIPELLTQESLAVVAAFGEYRVVGVPAVSDLTCADVLSMAGAESVVGVWGGGGGVAATVERGLLLADAARAAPSLALERILDCGGHSAVLAQIGRAHV